VAQSVTLLRGMTVAEALDQLFPQPARVAAKEEARVRVGDVPVAVVDLFFELARLPADEAREVARVVRRLLDDAVDALGARGNEQLAEQLQRLAAGVAPRHGEDGAGHLRPAEVDRVGNLRRRRVFGKERRKLHVGGAVDDEADVRAVDRHRHQERLAVETLQRGRSHEQHGFGEVLRLCRSGAKREQEREDRFHESPPLSR